MEHAIAQVLREHGLRATPQRIQIYDYLIRYRSHPDADEVYQAIRDTTNHDATLFKGIGLYLYKPRKMVYSVVSREEARKVVAAIRQVDPKAFINAVSTDQVTGRFYQKPKD